MRRPAITSLLASVAAALVLACGADGKSGTQAEAAVPSAPADANPVAPAVVTTVPPVAYEGIPTGLPGDFSVRAYQGADVIGGDTVDISSIVGKGRPVILNFWGGLCPPCRAEMPAFQRTHEALGDRVLFLGVDVGPFVGLGSRQDAKDLIAELGVTYPNGWTFNSRALKDYRLYGIPVTWFFTPEGKVYRVWNGAIPEDDLARLARDLAGLTTQ